MVSVGQISALIDFLEVHPELALGRCTRTKEGRIVAKRLWSECSALLNNISSDCVSKTADLWRMVFKCSHYTIKCRSFNIYHCHCYDEVLIRGYILLFAAKLRYGEKMDPRKRYYNEYKSKLLKKIKVSKGDLVATGGRPKKIVLSPLQGRLHKLLVCDVGDPFPRVHHNVAKPQACNSADSKQPKSERMETQVIAKVPNVIAPVEDSLDSDSTELMIKLDADDDSSHWRPKRSGVDLNLGKITDEAPDPGPSDSKSPVAVEKFDRKLTCDELKISILQQELDHNKLKNQIEIEHLRLKHTLEIDFIKNKNNLELEILSFKKYLLKRDLEKF